MCVSVNALTLAPVCTRNRTKQGKTWWEVALTLMQFVAWGLLSDRLVPLSTPFACVPCKITLFPTCSSLPPSPHNSVEFSTVIECCWKTLDCSKRKGGGGGGGRENKESNQFPSMASCITPACLARADAWPDGGFTYIICNAKFQQREVFSFHIT